MEYCPKCGGQLTKIEVERSLPRYLCPQKHLWEITQNSYSGSWHFHELAWATCSGCLEPYPALDLNYNKKCPKCHQKEKDAWQMDSKESHYFLTITPIVTEKGKRYSIDDDITLRPYPNPWGYGGRYGGGGAFGEAELAQILERANAEIEELKKHGMTNIKIERAEEQVLTSQVRMETEPTPDFIGDKDAITQSAEEAAKPEAKQLALI